MKTRSVAVWLVAASIVTGCGGQAAKETGTTAKTTTSTATASVSQLDQGPRAGEQPVNEERAEAGEKLFKDKGCSACHTFGKKLTGPDLQGVSMRRTAAWLENQILHPDQMVKNDPIARQLFAQHMLQMPNQGLTADEARAVIEYFKEQDHEAGESRD